MEELRSTEILDKEIQTDARKKAESILLKAETECKEILAGVDERVKNAEKEIEKTFKDKKDLFTTNADASVPLEKERFSVKFIGASVVEALSDYLKSLTKDRQVELIFKLLADKQKSISGKKVTAVIYGSNVDIFETKLKSSLGKDLISCSTIEYEKAGYEKIEGLTIHEGIILEAEDHSFKCRVTMEEIVLEILDKYRYELSSALFGGRLPA